MKNLRTIFLLSLLFFITACGENKNSNSALQHNQDTAKQQKSNPGVPLDNLHRSKTVDSASGKKDVKTGIPLDNLERSKSADSINQPLNR